MLTQWSASTKKISLKLHSPCRPTFFSWDQYPKLEMDFQLQFGCWSSYQDAGWVCNWHSFIKMVGCSLPGSRWSQKKLILMAACILPNYLLTSNLSQNQRWVEKAEERGDAPPPFYKHTYKLSYFFYLPWGPSVLARNKCWRSFYMWVHWH